MLALSLALPVGAAPAAAARRPLKVALISPTSESTNPSYEEFAWWRRLTLLAQEAARDLGVSIRVYEPGYWPTDLTRFVQALLSGRERPDYLVVSIHRGMGAELLRIAEAAEVPLFVIDAGLIRPEHQLFGGPGDHFRYWVGQLLPDNEGAGHELAVRLLRHAAARRTRDDGPLRVVSLGGIPREAAEVHRTAGLRRALEESGAEHLQHVHANWSRAEARRKMARLLVRYPDVEVVWAGGDAMALGALDALRASGRRPGRDVSVGGIDWTPEAIEAVRQGELVADVGGHFMTGAWAVILLHDIHHGRVALPFNGTLEMRAITPENVELYAPLVNRDWEAFDFSLLSLARSPNRDVHDFLLPGLPQHERKRVHP